MLLATVPGGVVVVVVVVAVAAVTAGVEVNVMP